MQADKTTEKFLKALEQLRYGSLSLELQSGKTYSFIGSEPGPRAFLKLHDEVVVKNMLLGGDVAFADDYRSGLWDSPDIASLVELAIANEKVLERFLFGAVLLQMISRLRYFFQHNSRKGSRKNIHAHYDLGNDFYNLWLDPSMSYSAGIFASPNDELLVAQHAKYDRIIDRISDRDGDVLEIGCGWGGFADRLTEKRDLPFYGVTISQAQHDFAKDRLDLKGDRVRIDLKDYRDIQGKYSAVVSIEMFEAVGERYWRTYFSKLKSVMSSKGRAVIQTITIADDAFARYRRTGDAIRSYIFPGGMLPSYRRFTEEATSAGLRVTDDYRFGHGYAKTLEKWLQNFEASLDDVRALGFDESFIRLWRYYLASCAGAFHAGRIDVMQVELEHA